MLATLLAATGIAEAQSVLRVFAGPQSRSVVFRELVAQYSLANPDLKIEIVGGDTQNEQRDFLARALGAKEAMFDVTLIDVLRPAQWARERWIEPLDTHLGAGSATLLARYLPASLASARIGGKVYALPFVADAQFLFYRRDLHEKYALKPPGSWNDLKASIQTIVAGENQRALQGFAATGSVAESATCAFLATLWGAGGALVKGGKPDLEHPALAQSLALWEELTTSKLMPADPGNIQTDRIRSDLAAGTLVYGLGWGYMWPHLQTGSTSKVQGKIGIASPPADVAGANAGCLGGWHVAVIAASPQKAEAVRFAQFLSSPEAARTMAIKAGALPVFRDLYVDAEVLAAQPWFSEALPVLMKARVRPQSPRYTEISEAVRVNFHAVLARTRTVDAALADIKYRLSVIFR